MLSIVMERSYRIHEFEQKKRTPVSADIEFEVSSRLEKISMSNRYKNRDGCCCHRNGEGSSEM